jgi:hypothetical protein
LDLWIFMRGDHADAARHKWKDAAEAGPLVAMGDAPPRMAGGENAD